MQENNAHFSADSERHVFAGPLPAGVDSLVSRICGIREMVADAALTMYQ